MAARFSFCTKCESIHSKCQSKITNVLGSIWVLMQFYKSLNSAHYIREKYHRDCFDALGNRTTTSNNKKIKNQTTYRVIDTEKAIGCY